MKHTHTITFYLVLLFISTQLLGLWLLSRNLHLEQIDGHIGLQHTDTILGPRPQTTGAASFIYIASAVVIGTLLLLLLIKYRKVQLWKFWYGLACFLTLSIALGVLLPSLWAFALALVLVLLKLLRPNIYTHNITEIFIYAGIGVFLTPLLDLTWGVVLLIAIALYDMYAVWKSKHMIDMAQFQTQTHVFAGLSIPYKISTQPISKGQTKILTTPPLKKQEYKNAILGGGDLAFPLIFTGSAMEHLLLQGFTLPQALSHSVVIVLGSSAALFLLLTLAKKDRFYPAMPFLAIGCFVGYGVMLLL
ncbi:MAG: presenilin family intramembrane aspartyl protease [Nanoarchaeota archaeon]